MQYVVSGAVYSLSIAGVAASAIWGYAEALTQVLMAAQGGGGGASNGGGGGGGGGAGPGEWVPENQAGWSESTRAYQAQITGRPGEAYLFNGVEYDGWDGTNLLDAKGPGYSDFLDSNGNWYDWFRASTKGGTTDLIERAARQLGAAGGRPVVWHVAEEGAAEAMRSLFAEEGLDVEVVCTPASR